MNTITTNELKKGDRVTLRCGWNATMEDNKKGNIRMATVEGIYTEMGSIYMHDVVLAEKNGETLRVVATPSQKKLKKTVSAIWG